MRVRLALLLLLATAAADAQRNDTPNWRSHGPRYNAAAIFRLDFQGVHLGMEQSEACAHLLSIGYVRQERADCGPHEDLRDDDGFLGSAPGTRMAPGVPGAPSESVKFFTLRYEQVGARVLVSDISIYTDERNRPAAVTQASIAAWGQPTFAGYYSEDYVQLIWAGSRRQALPENREDFGRCVYRPECEWQRGTDCGPILREFATPVAKVVVYAWGRHIEIRDYGEDLRRLTRSGEMRRRPWENNACARLGFVH